MEYIIYLLIGLGILVVIIIISLYAIKHGKKIKIGVNSLEVSENKEESKSSQTVDMRGATNNGVIINGDNSKYEERK